MHYLFQRLLAIFGSECKYDSLGGQCRGVDKKSAISCRYFPDCPSSPGSNAVCKRISKVSVLQLYCSFSNANDLASLAKTIAYRAGVAQASPEESSDPIYYPLPDLVAYCRNLVGFGGIWVVKNAPFFQGFPSPTPGDANNLLTFLINRFSAAVGPTTGLGCGSLIPGLTNPLEGGQVIPPE